MIVRVVGMGLLVGCAGVDLGDDDDSQPTSSCAGSDIYEAGIGALTDMGDHEVRILEATPDPPGVGDNAWVLQVVDRDGEPVTGLSPRIRPWMPLHGHGINPTRYGAKDMGDGTYTFAAFDLIMPGTWEFYVDLSGDDSEIATFAFCAQR